MTKPSIFIASSSEGLEVARALQYQLRNNARVTVWDEGVFGLGQSYLESLTTALDSFDFAIIVFRADDTVTSRDIISPAARGNVLFELGLFMGRLGRTRTFVVYDTHKRPQIISDLAGISFAPYDESSADNLLSAIAPACTVIRNAIKNASSKEIYDSPKTHRIETPTVLCASTSQYESIGFDQDVKIVTDAFPQSIVERNIDSQRLQSLLTLGIRYDIIHLLGFVHPRTGEFVFSDIGDLTEEKYSRLKFGEADLENPDSIQAGGLTEFVGINKTRLVILATCDSLLLAANLARVTNVIAFTDWMEPTEGFIRWSRIFYPLISQGRSLSDAFDVSKAAVKASMLLLMRTNLIFSGQVSAKS